MNSIEDDRIEGSTRRPRRGARILCLPIVLGWLAAASCGGTVVLGDRQGEQDSASPPSTSGAGATAGYAGVGGSGGSGNGPPEVPNGGSGGWDAGDLGDAPLGGSGGVPSWSMTLNPGPDPGQAGAPQTDIRVQSLSTSAEGAAVVAGDITGEASSYLPCFSATQSTDGFVLSYSAAGALDICQPVASAADDAIEAVALSPTGAISFAGRIGNTVSLGGSSLANNGEDDLVVAQLSSDGQTRWARSFGYEGVQEAFGVASDANEDVYVVGGFEGTILSGADVLIGVGSRSAFALKLDKEGNWVWGRSWGMGWAVAVDVAASSQGGVIITGTFDGPIELGGTQYVGVGASDGFLFELDPDGNVVWSTTFGNSLAQRPVNMAIGPAGEIALTGWTSGPLDWGDGPVDPGTDAVFVVVYDKDGFYQWSKQLPVGAEDDLVESKPSVAFNASGDVIVAGGFRGQVDFGQGPLLSSGQTDVFIAAWSSTGAPLWSYRYGDSRAQAARALSYREGVGLTVAGTFSGTINFGSEMLQASQYGPSTFLVRFP